MVFIDLGWETVAFKYESFSSMSSLWDMIRRWRSWWSGSEREGTDWAWETSQVCLEKQLLEPMHLDLIFIYWFVFLCHPKEKRNVTGSFCDSFFSSAIICEGMNSFDRAKRTREVAGKLEALGAEMALCLNITVFARFCLNCFISKPQYIQVCFALEVE